MALLTLTWERPDSLLSVATALAALVFIWRPILVWLVLLLLLSIIDSVISLPNIPNHQFFSIFVNGTLLLFIGLGLWRSRKSRQSGETIAQHSLVAAAPLLRLSALTLYFLTFWHKLNLDFLQSANSCAVKYFERLADSVPLTAELISWLPPGAMIMMALVAEGLIFVLLASKRLWFGALLVGGIFHLSTAIIGFRNFSALMLALYFLFIPPVAQKKIIESLTNFIKKVAGKKYSLLGGLQVWASGYFAIRLLAIYHIPFSSTLLTAAWVILVGFVLVFVAVTIVKHKLYRHYISAPFKPTQVWYLLIPLLLLLNGLTPYLGLKTTTAFSMFSNLRTEGGITNHIIMPTNILKIRYQQDLVEIIATNDPILQKDVIDSNRLIVWHMLQRHIRERTNEGVTGIFLDYVKDNQRQVTTAAEVDPALNAKESILERKLLHFRLVDTQSPTNCQW